MAKKNEMKITVKVIGSKDIFTFPMLPDSISVDAVSRFMSYDLTKSGEIQIPLGRQLTKFSWQGTLPGKARQKMPYIEQWTEPKEIQKRWTKWKDENKKLLLKISDTNVNEQVYLESFNLTYIGGFGDYEYTISFVQAVDIVVEVEKKATKNPNAGKDRPDNDTKTTYTVKKNDSLHSIAQKCMKNGDKYPALYAANKSLMDARNKNTGLSKYTIYAGQVLKIPKS